jgi:GNAT superfamily N-acetyltransferase
MITIRDYTENDTEEVGRLIADTYAEFNLAFASLDDQALMLGPFRHAGSANETHRRAITQILQSPIFFLAENKNEIVGVLRGRKDRLASLFVRKDYHHQGIGRRLVAAFEAKMHAQSITVIRVAATLYAVPFYRKLGYQKSTGVRNSWSFDGYGLPVQPMKKKLTETLAVFSDTQSTP